MDSPICPILAEIILIKPFGKANRMKCARQSTIQTKIQRSFLSVIVAVSSSKETVEK